MQGGAGASNIAPADGASKYLTLEAYCIVNINDGIYDDSFHFVAFISNLKIHYISIRYYHHSENYIKVYK